MYNFMRYEKTNPRDSSLSLHDALPISASSSATIPAHRTGTTRSPSRSRGRWRGCRSSAESRRSEEHTSELQSLAHLACRLLLERTNIAFDIATMTVEHVEVDEVREDQA